MAADTVLYGDFGATNLRLAQRSATGPDKIFVYSVADWAGIGDVLSDYRDKTGCNLNGADLYLAHTGHVQDGALALGYKKTNPWSFQFEDVRTAFGLNRIVPVNDLKAAAYAPLHANAALFDTLHAGTVDAALDCTVIGIGTGTGHAFLSPALRMVRETYGGHFPPAAVDGTQRAVFDIIRARSDGQNTLIFEDILSGAGIMRVYTALAALENASVVAHSPQDLLAARDSDPLVRKAASVFCGFAGLYANIVCTAAHAYGGVYLCGGVAGRLHAAGLFDAAVFRTHFMQNMVPVVARSLDAAPLRIARDDYTALYGLDVLAQGGGA